MQITDAETKVMQVLWEQSPLTADQVVERLADTETWHANTVKTLLSRLLNKKAVAADVDRRRYLYRPQLSREAFVASESRSLLDRLFGGKLAPLVSHFAQQRELSKQDIAELRRLLEDLDRD